MMKPRAPSDPPPTTSTEPYGGCHQIVSSTLPARVSPNQHVGEPFPDISATTLLSMDVSHSGWVRKEGYGFRSWKSRFMVLHHGCIYYFKETDSNAPKGKFALNGHRCLVAPDRERADRYPYVFKLVPDDEERRTYYISSPSKSEMEGWMKSINIDMQLYCPSEYEYVDTSDMGKSATCPTVPKKVPLVNKRTQSHSNLYDGNSNRAYPHSFPASNFMGKPAPLPPPKPGTVQQDPLTSTDDDEFYECVDGYFPEEEQYLEVLHDEADNNSSPSTGQHNQIPSSVKNGRPVPPVRPKPPPRPPDMCEDSESDGEDSEDELYLDLNKEHGKSKKLQSPVSPSRNGLSPTSPEKERPFPTPPIQNGSDDVPEVDDVNVTYLSVIDTEPLKRPSPKPPRPSPKPLPRQKRPGEEKKEFDYLPPECLRPEMHKNQAKILLELGRTVGQYIINASQSSDTKMSLSVWLASGVKHYLIFKRQEMYTLDPSLTLDEHFKDLRQLVKYYCSHPMPKSGQYLTAPFASK